MVWHWYGVALINMVWHWHSVLVGVDISKKGKTLLPEGGIRTSKCNGDGSTVNTSLLCCIAMSAVIDIIVAVVLMRWLRLNWPSSSLSFDSSSSMAFVPLPLSLSLPSMWSNGKGNTTSTGDGNETATSSLNTRQSTTSIDDDICIS